MINKKNEVLFIGILVGLIVLIIPLILAAAANVVTSNGALSFSVANTSAGAVYNISINLTDSVPTIPTNVTQINITLPAGFIFTVNSNYTLGTGLHSARNITFLNSSTVLTWQNLTHYLINGSSNLTTFLFNATALNPGTFNFTITLRNATYSTSYSNLYVGITDTSNPAVQASNFTSPTSLGGNYSGTLVLNVSIYDNSNNISYVAFNLTNLTGSKLGTFKALSLDNKSFNTSINTASYPDGTYNISVWVNDSSGYVNSTAVVTNVKFDNTGPTVTLTSSSATQTSLTLTIAATDAISGVRTSTRCTSDREGTGKVTITGTTSLVETALNCHTTYKYIVSCTDYAGNGGSSTQTSFTTSNCNEGGSSGGGGGGGTTYTTTYIAPTADLVEGYTKELSVKERVKVMVGSTTHHVGVKSLTTSSAIIEIASDPVSVNLDVGEDAKVDVSADGVYDLYVKLNAITNGKADVTIKSISETIPEGEGVVSTSGEITESGAGEGETGVGESNLTWLWILIGVIVLLIIIGMSVKKKK